MKLKRYRQKSRKLVAHKTTETRNYESMGTGNRYTTETETVEREETRKLRK